jgi:hypothetical protein
MDDARQQRSRMLESIDVDIEKARTAQLWEPAAMLTLARVVVLVGFAIVEALWGLKQEKTP